MPDLRLRERTGSERRPPLGWLLLLGLIVSFFVVRICLP
jgi:hypothetical protein